ncbi:MAG: aminopeptidase [Bacteroidota bacterium]
MTKRLVLIGVCGAIAIAVVVWGDLLGYAIGQGKGQLTIVWNARPFREVMEDPATPDSIRRKLAFIGQVRQYAIDSLGLQDTENYTTYFDQHGKELMWVVTACEPYRLREKTWHFPIVGSVPYKGFFDSLKAVAEAKRLDAEGYDISVRNPGGWSTLGWFRDPVLSGMLDRSDGDLAGLIIHEMSHATIYVKDSSDFNENLASFIGDQGAIRFLKDTYGEESSQLAEFIREDAEFRKRSDHLLRGAIKLDSLYEAITETSDEQKRVAKESMIRKIVVSLDTIYKDRPARDSIRRLPNNTLFMSFLRYQGRQTDFHKTLSTEFGGDIRLLIRTYRERFPFL